MVVYNTAKVDPMVSPQMQGMDRAGEGQYAPAPQYGQAMPMQPMVGIPMQQPVGMVPMMVPMGAQQQAMPIMSSVPWVQVMDRSQLFEGVTMKQSTKGCCRFGPCQPNMEWTAHEYTHSYAEGDAIANKLYLREDAPYCGRCMSWAFPGGRATRFDVWAGGVPEGGARPDQKDRLFYFEKGCTNGVAQCIGCDNNGHLIMMPCCCVLPYIRAHDNSGKELGKTQYICDQNCMVPKFNIEDTSGNVKYQLRQDTCCCGCVPLFKCGGTGGRCCHIPFYIRNPVTGEKVQGMASEGEAVAEVTQLFAGVKECCGRDNYAVNFPQNATQEDKLNIMGATLLLDIAFFEQGQ